MVKKEPNKPTKTTKVATRYIIIGILLTLINFLIYSILSNLIIQDNNYLWLTTLISTTIATLVAYLLHSKITWKERFPGKYGIYKFLVWNFTIALLIAPLLTQLFSLITPLYNFAFQIIQDVNLPFSYEFTLTTGAFILTNITTMIINFLFYDRYVFGKKTKEESTSSHS